MKVRFLKKHLDNETGGIGYVEDPIGEYLIKMGVVVKYEEKVRTDDEIREGYEKRKPVKKK